MKNPKIEDYRPSDSKLGRTSYEEALEAYADEMKKEIAELKEELIRKESLFDKHQKNSWKLVEQIKELKAQERAML